MTWVDHRLLFYLKFTQEILCILSNQNKLFSFHLFSARSVTWNLYEIKLLLRKELGARQLPGISVFLSSHHICLPACRIGVADGDGEGKGRRLWTGSPQKQKENSANCTGDFCLSSSWDMTAHWLVMSMPTLFSILASSICLHLALVEVSREEDMGTETARGMALSL